MECREKTIEMPKALGASREAELAEEREAFPSLRSIPLWKRLLPFVIAGGILVYLFRQIDIRECFDAFFQADIFLYIPWLIVFILITFLLDTQNLAAVIRNFNYPVSWKNALSIRGVTYLIMTIDYSLGMGSLVYYLKHDLGIPVMRSTGLMMFFNAITQKTLVYMTVIGLFLLSPESAVLHKLLIFCIGFALFDLAFIVVLKKLPSRGLMLKIKNLNLLKVFHEASWRSYFVLIFWRLVYYSLFIVFFYVAVRAFHMSIPLVAILAYVPIILLVISMPIAPCGFGTAQAAMIYLFKDYGTSVNIMAFGLTYSTSIIALRSLIGLCFAGNITGISANNITIK